MTDSEKPFNFGNSYCGVFQEAGNPQGQGEHHGLFQLLLIGMNLRKEILSALAASLAKYRIADYGNTLG